MNLVLAGNLANYSFYLTKLLRDNGINAELPFIIPTSAGLFSAGAVPDLQHTGGGSAFSGPTPNNVSLNGANMSYTGRTNGGRATFRFGQNANQLGKNVQVTWTDGKTYTIPDPTKRYDNQGRFNGIRGVVPFLWKPRSDKDGNPVVLEY